MLITRERFFSYARTSAAIDSVTAAIALQKYFDSHNYFSDKERNKIIVTEEDIINTLMDTEEKNRTVYYWYEPTGEWEENDLFSEIIESIDELLSQEEVVTEYGDTCGIDYRLENRKIGRLSY